MQESANDEVEALTVADVNVAIRVRRTDPLNGFKDLLAKLLLESVFAFVTFLIVLKEGFVRKSSWHVHLDLMSIRRRVLRVNLTDQSQVVCVPLSERCIEKALSTSYLQPDVPAVLRCQTMTLLAQLKVVGALFIRSHTWEPGR